MPSDAAMGKIISHLVCKNTIQTGYKTQIFFAKQMGTADENQQGLSRSASHRPGLKTMDYMSTGMHLQTIDSKKEFNLKKVAQYTEAGKQYSVYDAAESGIAFEINDQNVCTGIIIYEPNKGVTTTYIAFHNHMQIITK